MYAMFRSVLGMPLPQSQPPVRAVQPPVEALSAKAKKKPIAKSAKSKPVKPQE